MPEEGQDKSDWREQFLSSRNGEVGKRGKHSEIGTRSQSHGQSTYLSCAQTPAAHQLECHPWLQQPGFNEWHKKHGIAVMQYSPFGNQNEIYDKGKEMGKLMDDPTLVEIGKKYGKTGAQVALAWGIAHG